MKPVKVEFNWEHPSIEENHGHTQSEWGKPMLDNKNESSVIYSYKMKWEITDDKILWVVMESAIDTGIVPVGIHICQEGKKRCNTCGIFIMWDGLLCPCCNMQLRYIPVIENTRKNFKNSNEFKILRFPYESIFGS